MNFLAHFFLAQEKESWIVGNFLADYLRRSQVSELPPDVQEGVALHLEIDRLTDAHPTVRAQVRQMLPHHGKYAPVVLDVFWDYFLTKNWHVFTAEDLPGFSSRIYAALEAYREIMPPEIQERLPRMVQSDWLVSYGHRNGLDFVFQRLQRRMSKPELIHAVLDTHALFYEALNEAFLQFFPDIHQHLAPWKQEATLQNGGKW